MATLLDDTTCVDPARFYRECLERRLPADWWGEANFFDLPLGRGPGRGHVLLRYDDLTALDAAADHALTFSGTDADHQYTLDPVTVLGARCLSPGGEADADAVFLVELADRRYHLARIPVDKAYNVYAADGAGYLSATENTGTPWTWQGVVNDLAATLGVPTAQFALPFTPDTTPQNLTYWGTFAWDALCDVLDRLACAARLDPAANTFSVVRLGSADAAADSLLDDLDAAGDKTWDGFPLDPVRAWRPEKVQVQFLRRPRPTDGSTPYYSVDVTLTAAAGVVAGSYVQLKDDLTAQGATGTPANSAALATRAAERAADWLRKRSGYGRPFHRIYLDFEPDLPGVALGSTLGRVGLDDRGADDRRGAMRVEVSSRPDQLLETWTPFAALPPWFPPDASAGGTTSGLVKARCKNTTGTNITVSSPGTSGFDGVTPSSGDVVFVTDNTTGAENGVYTFNGSASPLTRTTDADSSAEIVNSLVMVSEGTQWANTVWRCVTPATITVGSTSIAYVEVFRWVFPARLTTASGGAWKFFRRKLSAGVWGDDGAEWASFAAIPLETYGSTTITPAAGDRVVMWWSKQSGKFEFQPLAHNQMSVDVDASGFKFVNDQTSPGSYYYYGTNGAGTKGYYLVTSAIQTANTDTVHVTLTTGVYTWDAQYQMSITSDGSGLKFVNDQTSPGNDSCYRTNGTGTKGWNPYIAVSTTRSVGGPVCWWNSSGDAITTLGFPLADGTYALQVTIAGGVPTMHWV